MGKKHKRKYLVDSGYQLSQVAAVVIAHVLVVMLIGALFSWFYLIVWDGSVTVNYNQQVPFYITVLLLIVTLFSVYFSLRRSRSVAGMMKKIHMVLDEAGRGQFPEQELTFRRSDHFRQLAGPLNLCLAQLQAKQDAELNGIAEQLQGVVDGISSGQLDRDQIRSALEQVIADARQQGGE